MEFTTHLELHSQATRLFESTPCCVESNTKHKTGFSPSLTRLSNQSSLCAHAGDTSTLHNSFATQSGNNDFQHELLPLHSPLLRESLLVSFPPLSYMLKSSGSSYLISGLIGKISGWWQTQRCVHHNCVQFITYDTTLHTCCCSLLMLNNNSDCYITIIYYIKKSHHTQSRRRFHMLLVTYIHCVHNTQSLQDIMTQQSRHISISKDLQQVLDGCYRHWNKHASERFPEAQYAFKDLMIHWVLQFALRIAFRCVLHRCGNQDIHC